MAPPDRDRYHKRHFKHLSDRELLLIIWETIMADFTAANAALAKLQTDVDALLAAAPPVPVDDQPAVDALTAAIGELDAKVVAATPVPTPPPPPPPPPPQAARRS